MFFFISRTICCITGPRGLLPLRCLSRDELWDVTLGLRRSSSTLATVKRRFCPLLAPCCTSSPVPTRSFVLSTKSTAVPAMVASLACRSRATFERRQLLFSDCCPQTRRSCFDLNLLLLHQRQNLLLYLYIIPSPQKQQVRESMEPAASCPCSPPSSLRPIIRSVS